MKLSNILKLLAFTKVFKLFKRRPVRKASGGFLKRYLLWKLFRR